MSENEHHHEHHHGHNHDCSHGDHGQHEHHNHKEHNHKPKGLLSRLFSKAGDYTYISGSFALAAAAYFTPDLSAHLSPITHASALTVYGASTALLMYKTGEVALNRLESYGIKKDFSLPKIGILGGLVHTGAEALVSSFAMLKGSVDMAFSNIIGGAPAHSWGILGLAAATTGLASLNKDRESWTYNLIAMGAGTGAVASYLAFNMHTSTALSSVMGAIMLWGGWHYFKNRPSGAGCSHTHNTADDHQDVSHSSCGHSHGDMTHHTPKRDMAELGAAILSMAALSHGLVDHVLDGAQHLGVSETFMGAVLTAGLTAMPEGMFAIIAAKAKKSAVAVGTLLGCNTANALLVGGSIAAYGGLSKLWGGVALDIPQSLQPTNPEGLLHWGTYVASAVVLTALLNNKSGEITRKQGAALLAACLTYYGAAYALSGDDHNGVLHQHGAVEKVQDFPISANSTQDFDQFAAG